MNNNREGTNPSQIIDKLYHKIQNNLLECDLLISLFYSSATSQKRSTVCDPYPHRFKDTVTLNKQFDRLLDALNHIPNLHLLNNDKSLFNKLPDDTIHLMDYIINTKYSFNIQPIDYNVFVNRTHYLKDVLSHLQTSRLPNQVFELIYEQIEEKEEVEEQGQVISDNDNCSSSSSLSLRQSLERSFIQSRIKEYDQMAKKHGELFGYHGSSNDSWNSIIKGIGFADKYISSQCIFGPGFYFSNDSNVSHSFVKMGSWWKHSIMGDRVGCLSACTILNTNQTSRGLKVHLHQSTTASTSTSSSSSSSQSPYIHNDKDRELPDHYILCKTGSHIRVKYLLIFKDHLGGSVDNTIAATTRTSPSASSSTLLNSSSAVTTSIPTNTNRNVNHNQWRKWLIIISIIVLFISIRLGYLQSIIDSINNSGSVDYNNNQSSSSSSSSSSSNKGKYHINRNHPSFYNRMEL